MVAELRVTIDPLGCGRRVFGDLDRIFPDTSVVSIIDAILEQRVQNYDPFLRTVCLPESRLQSRTGTQKLSRELFLESNFQAVLEWICRRWTRNNSSCKNKKAR